ncbi:hypothetical protein FRC02_004953 [Tulasnella sp. 418]|nr:hypothetical protein FRC02_004953 [Tulasnella sp. 418]
MSSDSAHLLSLKVMRVSRPALATSFQPFFSTSPSLSSHATASVMSLQGTSPLPGHPKTLRDFALTELLTLPSTFGSICLGETFTSGLCINNESSLPVAGVYLKVEIQTATTKILLAEFGGRDKVLQPNEVIESVVSHEIKELNQHVLACAVTYMVPEAMLDQAGEPDDPSNPTIRTFRKYYKFTVSNPLSVKTKVHIPKSPSALFSRIEREKVFLEIHVQNLTQEPLCFERMKLECVDGWEAEDVNVWSPQSADPSSQTGGSLVSVFSGATAIMQPQDARQYLYILSPRPDTIPSFPVIHQPGSIIPLGRLDISWRTGRLLTSILSRRIPLLPAASPAPALPPHLMQQSPRPQTPTQRIQSPGPNRPSTPTSYKARVPPGRPQSPGPSTLSMAVPNANPQYIPRPDVEVDLIVQDLARDKISIEMPFKIEFSLTVSALLPYSSIPGDAPRGRMLLLAVQHTIPPRSTRLSQSLEAATSNILQPATPRTPHHNHVPSSLSITLSRRSSTASLTLKRSDSTVWADSTLESSPVTVTQSPTSVTFETHTVDSVKHALPTPYRTHDQAATMAQRLGQSREETDDLEANAIVFLGPSVIRLPPFRIAGHHVESEPPKTPLTENGSKEPEPPRGQASVNFHLDFLPLREGFAAVGGLRVILLGDRVIEEGEDEADRWDSIEPKIVKEWEQVAEIWVSAA